MEHQKGRDMHHITMLWCILKCTLEDVVVAAERSAARR